MFRRVLLLLFYLFICCFFFRVPSPSRSSSLFVSRPFRREGPSYSWLHRIILKEDRSLFSRFTLIKLSTGIKLMKITFFLYAGWMRFLKALSAAFWRKFVEIWRKWDYLFCMGKIKMSSFFLSSPSRTCMSVPVNLRNTRLRKLFSTYIFDGPHFTNYILIKVAKRIEFLYV